MRTVLIRVTTLNVENPPPGTAFASQWDSLIHDSMRVARRAFRRARVRVRLSNRRDLPIRTSLRLLTTDVMLQAGHPSRFKDTLEDHDLAGIREYQRLKRLNIYAPHYLQQEYFAYIASIQARRVGEGIISSEARAILGQNRVPGEVCTYWVPGISSPSQATGETVFAPFYSRVEGVEGIFIAQHARDDTLAHELGHLLMRISHCSRPDQHRLVCQCAGRDNLMHWSGNQRRGRELSDAQRECIRDRGSEWFQ